MERINLGNSIREARLQKGFSQEELSEKVGVTPTHIKHIESGHRQPSVPLLYNLVKTLDLSLDNIFFVKNNSQSYNDIQILISTCSENQLQLIKEIIIAIKNNS